MLTLINLAMLTLTKRVSSPCEPAFAADDIRKVLEQNILELDHRITVARELRPMADLGTHRDTMLPTIIASPAPDHSKGLLFVLLEASLKHQREE